MAIGTLALHVELERAVAALLGTEDALVYAERVPRRRRASSSPLLGDRDYVFCDEMTGPSLADGVRLCRARVYAYRNNDMDHLEDRLKRSRAARFRVIATDGVFPITGQIARLSDITRSRRSITRSSSSTTARASAFSATDGRGTFGGGASPTQDRPRHRLVRRTRWAAAPAASSPGRVRIVGWLRQKSRPHLASTALAPVAAATARKAIELLGTETQLRGRLTTNLRVFKEAMSRDAGLLIEPEHPAISIVVRGAVLAQRLTDYLYRRGIFAIGYCHPVVPEGDARVGIRISAGHSREDLEALAKAIGQGMKDLKIPL